jgi:hypothetical protein
VKVSTDKVNMASVEKTSFSGKLADRLWFKDSEKA